MSLEIPISQLLYRFPCVTVPQFGAFITETISANIQESTQTFFPPKKIVSFNSFIKNNDGLLANHLAANLKITHEEAIKKINDEVIIWKEKLQNNEIIVLKNIGSFRNSVENNLVFEPSNHLNYLTQSFGLTPVISPIIKREVAEKLNIEIPVVDLRTNNIEEKYEPRFSLNKLLKYAAVLLVTVGGGAFGYSAYINQLETQETLLVQAQVQKEITSKLQEATFLITTPTVIVNSTETTILKPFHIMAGAFRSQQNAEKELQKLTKKGFEATILNKNNQNLFPVAFVSYATFSEAQNNLEEIRKINPDAWIFINEN